MFSQIVYSQASFSSNPKVRAIELSLGNFPYDDEFLRDGMPRTVVGPQEIEGGIVYYGHWSAVSSEREGFGLQIWPDGSKYVGYWKNGKANGLGRLIHSDGDVYTGNWKDDAANGLGEYISVDGMRYKGEWVNDQQSGKGIIAIQY